MIDAALIGAVGGAPTRDNVDEAADRTSRRILDAALQEAGAVGLQRITVEDVVRRAGVSLVTEVAATLALRGSQDHSAWLALVVAGYLSAFALLTMVLRAGIPVGVAYGIWGALGTACTAVLAAVIFGDPFTWPIVAGIGLIIVGVLLIEFGSHSMADS